MEIEKLQKIAEIFKKLSNIAVLLSPVTFYSGIWMSVGSKYQFVLFSTIMYIGISIMFAILSSSEYKKGNYKWSLFFSSPIILITPIFLLYFLALITNY